MNIKTTTLTITVLSPFNVPHYLIVKKGIDKLEVMEYIVLLDGLGYNILYVSIGKAASLTIYEPHLVDAEIIKFNDTYFPALDISEQDKVLPAAEMGDPLFLELFDKMEKLFVKDMFSNLNNKELEKKYRCGESSITRKINAILDRIKIKFPTEKLRLRSQFKKFAIKIGVHKETRCKQCGQKL